MSTKIYNGFRIQGRTIEQITRDLFSLRPALESKAKELTIAMALRIAVNAYDKSQFFTSAPRPAASDYYLEALSKIRNRQHLVVDTLQRDPAVDFESNVVLFPLEGDQVLGVTFVENKELLTLIQRLPGYEEFSYWNNADKPDNVSAKRWAERKTLWDAAVPSGVFSRDGLSASLLDVYGNSRYSDGLKQPTQAQLDAVQLVDGFLEARAEDLALFQCYTQYLPESADSGVRGSPMTVLRNISKSPEYATQVARFRRGLRHPLMVQELVATP